MCIGAKNIINISIIVTATPKPYSRYTISIQSGYNSTTGWIKVESSSQSGVICYSGWSLSAADVVCRQMGYVGAYSNRRK